MLCLIFSLATLSVSAEEQETQPIEVMKAEKRLKQQRRIDTNPFMVMKAEKRLKQQKCKQALLRRLQQIRRMH